MSKNMYITSSHLKRLHRCLQAAGEVYVIVAKLALTLERRCTIGHPVSS